MATGLKNSMQRLRSFKAKLILSFAALIIIPFAFIYFNLDRKLEDAALADIKSSLLKQAVLVEDRLRAADACQLAAALIAARERPRGFQLVTLDCRLRQAAELEGFSVLPA